MPHSLLQSLNPEQQKAAEHVDGPVLILAGAGSGKTKTLTHRVAYLISQGVAPMNILAVTFTNKAAQEMKERISNLLGKNQQMPIVGTFHAICLRILRTEIEHLGYDRNYVIYDTQDQQALIKRVCAKLHVNTKETNPNIFRFMISSAKNELLTPKQYMNRASEHNEEIAAKIYVEYQKQLKANNAVDFDDLIMLTVQVFQKHPEILKKYQEFFKYIMVDEYQDTNHAQYTLMKMLAEKYQNICVVGDDWQAIYSFRGANLQNILNFEKDYPEAKVYLLQQNYRSTQAILDSAQAVIEKNKNQKAKKLWTETKGGDAVKLYEAQDEREEASMVARSIRDKVVGSSQDYNDFAVLYRTNAQSRAIEEVMLEYGIPYRVIGGMKFYDRREVKDVLAYLTFIKNPQDTISFERIINTPKRGLGPSTVDRVVFFSVQMEQDLLSVCRHADQVPGLQQAKINALKEFGELMARLVSEEENLTLDFFIEKLLEDTGYKASLLDGTAEGETRYENTEELRTVAKRYKTLEGFLENVALVADTDDYDESKPNVTLMTLHASKGLEFKHVYMIGLEEGILPHTNSMMSQDDIDEERRLCYVGMTRARNTLQLFFATYRTLYGQAQVNGVSRFMEEIPEGLIEKNLTEHGRLFGGSKSRGKDEDVDEDGGFMEDVVVENPFHVGDGVFHATFGKGKVVEVDDDIVHIKFEDGGTRELAVEHAPLKKI